MVKKEFLKKVGKAVGKAANAAVTMEVNSTCPFTVYQPKLPKKVEQMRKK